MLIILIFHKSQNQLNRTKQISPSSTSIMDLENSDVILKKNQEIEQMDCSYTLNLCLEMVIMSQA